MGLHSKGYQLYVRGHAVFAKPLCPAPLYVELAARAATLLAGESGSLLPLVEDLDIKAPLGLSMDRSVSLRLSRANDKDLARNFEMTIEENGGTKSAPSVYTTGSVALEASESKQLTNCSGFE